MKPLTYKLIDLSFRENSKLDTSLPAIQALELSESKIKIIQTVESRSLLYRKRTVALSTFEKYYTDFRDYEIEVFAIGLNINAISNIVTDAIGEHDSEFQMLTRARATELIHDYIKSCTNEDVQLGFIDIKVTDYLKFFFGENFASKIHYAHTENGQIEFRPNDLGITQQHDKRLSLFKTVSNINYGSIEDTDTFDLNVHLKSMSIYSDQEIFICSQPEVTRKFTDALSSSDSNFLSQMKEAILDIDSKKIVDFLLKNDAVEVKLSDFNYEFIYYDFDSKDWVESAQKFNSFLSYDGIKSIYTIDAFTLIIRKNGVSIFQSAASAKAFKIIDLNKLSINDIVPNKSIIKIFSHKLNLSNGETIKLNKRMNELLKIILTLKKI